MAKNANIQVADNLMDNFRGYASLLRKIKQRVLIAQQRTIYAANEEMLRMYWDIGGMLQQSQDTDGWGKKTLQRLSVDLKNDYSEIKGFSVRNMQCMIQFFNEYTQELTMVKRGVSPIAQSQIAQLECKKDGLREMIDMIESEETVNRVGKYLKRVLMHEQPPCQFSIEELKEQLNVAEKEARLGLGCSTEELRKAAWTW